MEEAAKHKGSTQAYDLASMRKREETLRQKISDARAQILKDPSLLQKLVDDLFADVGDLQTEASMVANLDQLDDLINQFQDEDTLLANLGTDDGYGTAEPPRRWARSSGAMSCRSRRGGTSGSRSTPRGSRRKRSAMPPRGKPTYSSEAIIPPGVKFRVVNVDTATGTVTLQQL